MYAWGEENNITMNVLSFLIVGVAANSVEDQEGKRPYSNRDAPCTHTFF